MKTICRWIILFFLGIPCLSQPAQAPSPAPSDAARDRAIRSKVTLENWDDGGDLSRWVYLHSTEVFPSAIVRRAGPVRDLPIHLRPEVREFELKGATGPTPLPNAMSSSPTSQPIATTRLRRVPCRWSR